MNANLCFQAGCEYMLREFSTKESKIADLKVGNGNNYQTQYVLNMLSLKWTIQSEPPEFGLERSSVNQPSIPKSDLLH